MVIGIEPFLLKNARTHKGLREYALTPFEEAMAKALLEKMENERNY